MTIHDVRFPNESPQYRQQRDELLQAEIELRDQIEHVAALRRQLPPGGTVPDYTFAGADGPVRLADLFGAHRSLVIYSFMYGPDASQPCPLCSAFMDSLNGQMAHIRQRTALVVVARSPLPRIQALVQARGWHDLTWLSAADNDYPIDYKSEMPDGAQVPMCNVFVKEADVVRHFWNSELFFAPSKYHPRHVDMLWPLWHIFDITPQGRGDFMPELSYE